MFDANLTSTYARPVNNAPIIDIMTFNLLNDAFGFKNGKFKIIYTPPRPRKIAK